jgi:hypothetical protein
MAGYLVLYQKVLVSKMAFKTGISQLQKANSLTVFYNSITLRVTAIALGRLKDKDRERE